MSFSSEVKAELCRSRDMLSSRALALAEAYGVLLYANSFTPSLIRVITANDAFAARLPHLFRHAFGTDFDSIPAAGTTGRRSYRITDPRKLTTIFAAFGLDTARAVTHSINLAVLEHPNERVAFLRGAFLAGGSVTEPTGRYHLELTTGHASVSRGLHAMLYEMGFTPGSTTRAGHAVLYFKKGEIIANLLTTMGATNAAMELLQALVDKDFSGEINRRTNCDMANAGRVSDTAGAQLAAIRRIEAGPGLDCLSPALQSAALLRIANPESSLSELAQLSFPPVSKSCISYRIRKLMQIAEGLGKE